MHRALLAATGLLAAGCAPEVDCDTLTIDTDQHTNAAVIAWSSEAGAARIEYTVGDRTFSRPVSGPDQTDHHGTLFGLPALTTIDFAAITTVGDRETRCEGTLTTNNLPPELPSVTVTVHEEDLVSEEPYLLIVVMGTDESVPAIIDREGNYLWYWDGPVEHSTQIEVADDGLGVLISSYAFDHGVDNGRLYRVDLLGEELSSIAMTQGHHAFEQLPDVLAYLSLDVRDWYNEDAKETQSVVGDAIIELPDSGPESVFSTWDWTEPVPHNSWGSEFYPQGRDWTHGNAVSYNEEDDTYTVSLALLNTILEVDRSTGTVIHEISEDTYEMTSGRFPFYQHDVHHTEDDTLLMLNHFPSYSACSEYMVGHDQQRMRRIWEFSNDRGVKSNFLGQCRRLANGNTMVNYGSAGLLQEVTPEGEIVWEVQTGLGYWLGNGEMIHSVYEAAAR